MKRILLLFLISITPAINAQDLRDAYRYSDNELTGTARFMAMSGAFGALGGDISAMALNPASSAVFLSSSATVSLNYRDLENDIRFNDGFGSRGESNFDLNNVGGVFVFTGNENNDWRKFSIGVNYNTELDYEENYFVQGSSNNSIDQYFLNYANGVPLDLLQLRDNETISDLYSFLGENEGYAAQQAFLGYQGYIIEPESENPENTEYFSLISPGSFDQRYRYAAYGMKGKLTFNFGTQYKDFLYLGLNLNSHFINYENSTEFGETNSNEGSETTEVYFGNDLYTNGDGFSFQLGGIAKATENIRVGFTYDSPTWYTVREESTQYLETNSSLDEFVRVAPQIINVYPEYQFRTPSKLNGSFAYLFGKKGLISFDYSWQDFSNIKFRSNYDIEFGDLNDVISNEMKSVSTFRVGGEYRIANFSMRAGYRFEESPFEDKNNAGDLTGYTGGLGYSFGNFNVDLAYSYANYSDGTTGTINPTYIDRDLSNFVVSLTFGL
ncbi:outer membrane protein transport protein [Gramella lutea]|uniref:Outer membrane protein transport protein n=1 Tax=Christiangramia lutea TaxID=1607951 RepID=A0A9X2ABB3_9FLAO|nr:outer membrane protein transport protein [Christiangramia lutea]MCH4824066.1 outer membrane protein transport protein [Christiangramia lutea]